MPGMYLLLLQDDVIDRDEEGSSRCEDPPEPLQRNHRQSRSSRHCLIRCRSDAYAKKAIGGQSARTILPHGAVRSTMSTTVAILSRKE